MSTQTLLPIYAEHRTSTEVFMSFDQIAAVFGITKQQAIRCHNRGLKKLRELLEDDENGMSAQERTYPVGSVIEVREPGGKKWLKCRVKSLKPHVAVVIENDPVWRGAELPRKGWRQVKGK